MEKFWPSQKPSITLSFDTRHLCNTHSPEPVIIILLTCSSVTSVQTLDLSTLGGNGLRHRIQLPGSLVLPAMVENTVGTRNWELQQ